MASTEPRVGAAGKAPRGGPGRRRQASRPRSLPRDARRGAGPEGRQGEGIGCGAGGAGAGGGAMGGGGGGEGGGGGGGGPPPPPPRGSRARPPPPPLYPMERALAE